MANLIIILSVIFTVSAFGYGTGVSTHPLQLKERLITTEFGGFLSNGKGAGLQARYTQKINSKLTGDGGFGFSGGDRKYRVFGNLDYELYPDYLKQPRISVRGSLQRGEEFDQSVTRFGVAPTISKGFLVYNSEVFPYLTLPLALDLRSDDSTYDFVSQISAGITGNLPFQGYEHLLANFEGTLNVDDGYSGVFFGISYPLN